MKSKEDVNILFKQGDTDERILKSIAEDTEHEYDSEELSKALDKAKLVQKEVQVRGKNGQMHTRKQWVRAGEDQPSTKQPKAQEDTKETSSKPKQEEKKEHWTKVGTSQEAKSQIAQMLASGKSREDCMSDFKAQGVTWKEHENPAINWMRAAMAMNKHLTSGAGISEKDDASKGNSVEETKISKDETSVKETEGMKANESTTTDSNSTGSNKTIDKNRQSLIQKQQDIKSKYPEASKFLEKTISNIPVSNSPWENTVIRILPGIGMAAVVKYSDGTCLFELPGGGSSNPPVYTDKDEDFISMLQNGIDSKQRAKKLGKDEIAKRKEFIKNTKARIRKETTELMKDLDSQLKNSDMVIANDNKNGHPYFRLSRTSSGKYIKIPTDKDGNLSSVTRDTEYEISTIFGNSGYSEAKPRIKDKLEYMFTYKGSPTDEDYDESAMDTIHPYLKGFNPVTKSSNFDSKTLGAMDDFVRKVAAFRDSSSPDTSFFSFPNGDAVNIQITHHTSSDGYHYETSNITYASAFTGKTYTISNYPGAYNGHLQQPLSLLMYSSLTGDDNFLITDYVQSHINRLRTYGGTSTAYDDTKVLVQ